MRRIGGKGLLYQKCLFQAFQHPVKGLSQLQHLTLGIVWTHAFIQMAFIYLMSHVSELF